MDLAKRNALVERYLTQGGPSGTEALLTDADRADIAAARALGLTPIPSSTNPETGDLEVDLGPLMELSQRFRKGWLNIGPVFGDPEGFAAKDPADAFAELILLERKQEIAQRVTIDLHAFYDGNDEAAGVAPNVDLAGEVIRDTLLEIANRPDVLAAAVDVHELPSIDNPADDDMWVQAEHVYFWTRAALSEVRSWCKSLRPTSVVKIALRKVLPPAGQTFPPKTILVQIMWD